MQPADPRTASTIPGPVLTVVVYQAADLEHDDLVQTAWECALLIEPFGTRDVVGDSDHGSTPVFERTRLGRALDTFFGFLADASGDTDARLRQQALRAACVRLSTGHDAGNALRAAQVLHRWLSRAQNRVQRSAGTAGGDAQ
jgi:hypothetical protein